MGRKKRAEEDGKYRNYKLLLYLDNAQHMATLEYIKTKYTNYIGIKHTGAIDGDTGEIVGKEHYHVYLCFEHQRAWYKLCSELGFPDNQFCRPIDRMNGALLYLCHTNTPDKEQYSLSALFGDASLINKTALLIRRYRESNVFVPDAVEACVVYISSLTRILSFSEFTLWAVRNNLYKGAQSPLVRECLHEHNAELTRLYARKNMDVPRQHLIKLGNEWVYEEDLEEIV